MAETLDTSQPIPKGREIIIIEGHAFPARPKATGGTPEVRAEEDLHFGAKDTLEDLRTHPIPPYFREKYGYESWQGWLLFLVHPVAKHYGVDKDELWRLWSQHYGFGVALEALQRDGLLPVDLKPPTRGTAC